MSVTPPPTYSPPHLNGQLDNKTHSKDNTATTSSSTFVQDIKQALESTTSKTDSNEQHSTTKETVQVSPTLVNVFNYTGAVFGENEHYEHADLLPSFPPVSWEPLEEFEHVDRAQFADAGFKRLFDEIAAQGGKIRAVTPTSGTSISGASLKKLSAEALDDLSLLVATRGVVAFRAQHDLSIDEQLAIGRHWGRLHKHATTGVPRREGLEEVHVVYADKGSLPDRTAFASSELYHSDVTYELQPPSTTSLKLVTAPSSGGDTLFTSGAAVYSSFSPSFQKYLETLYAAHSGFEQAKGARSAGQHVRREPIETIHPVVRVHPVTGVKSVFINAGFTRRIVGVPKSESDWVLRLLNEAFSSNPEFTARIQWNQDDVVIWDNRVVNHSATFDFWPERRHAVRVTPHGERPLSVEEYERKSGKPAVDWLVEKYKALGVELPKLGHARKDRGFKD